jgi:hypothetical protein
MKRFLYVLIASSMILSCSPKQEHFEPEFNHESKELKVVIEPYKNKRELNLAYNKWVGNKHKTPIDTDRLGWSTWTDKSCTIHIDASLKETNIKEYFQTLGHEYAHCLYGKYHN